MSKSVYWLNIHFQTWLSRVIIFGLLWWLLTGGALNSWVIGLPVVLLAALVSVLMLPALSWSLSGLFRFALFFLWHSLRGGIDVARCAFHPDMPISPILHDFRFRLPAGPARILMANVVNLLPGTLSVEVDDDCLTVHVLEQSSAFTKELQLLEQQLADILSIELPGVSAGSC